MTAARPRDSVGVNVTRDGLALLAKRLSSQGAGIWPLPDDHVEFGKSVGQCAGRDAEHSRPS